MRVTVDTVIKKRKIILDFNKVFPFDPIQRAYSIVYAHCDRAEVNKTFKMTVYNLSL